MLGTLDPAKKAKWSQHISQLVHAYNCTKNEATGYSPYYLLFGREARLPVDLCFGTSPDGDNEVTYQQYVETMRHELQEAYQLAEETSLKNHQRNKQHYDKRVKPQMLEKGDRVFIRNLAQTGKHKLEDRWNSVPYIVVERLRNLPVYKLRPETGTGRVRTLHRDHLLPIGDSVRIPALSGGEDIRPPVTRAQTVKKKQLREKVATTNEPNRVETSSESDDEICYPESAPGGIQTKPLHTLLPELVSEKVVHRVDESRTLNDNVSEGSLKKNMRENSYSNPEMEVEELPKEKVQGSNLPTVDISSTDRRPKRTMKPVMKLSYDNLGKPSDIPLSIVYNGMVIHLGNSRERSNMCGTFWCHPLAQCAKCNRVNSNSALMATIQI